MLMNSGHADIGVELNELYNIAVSSQRRILKIAEILSSQPRAKASTSGSEALDKGKKPVQEDYTMHKSPDTEEEPEFQSAEEGEDDEDDDAEEIDAEGSDEDEHNAAQAEKDDANTRTNIEGIQDPELNEDVMDVEIPIPTSSVVPDNISRGLKQGTTLTTTAQGSIIQLQEQEQEQYRSNVIEPAEEGQRTVQPPLHASASTSHLLEQEMPRKLRSYGRKRKGGLDVEVKHKSTRATKKSTVLRSAEFILPAPVTVSLYEKNLAAYAWDPDQNPKDILVQMYQFSLTRLDLKTMENGMHVSNRVIDMFARLMNWGGRTAKIRKLERYIVEPVAVEGILKMGKFDKLSDASLLLSF
nr:uncharacterized protein LOC113693312 [Coffea arabica]